VSLDSLAHRIAREDGVAPSVVIAASVRRESWVRATAAGGRLTYAADAAVVEPGTLFEHVGNRSTF